ARSALGVRRDPRRGDPRPRDEGPGRRRLRLPDERAERLAPRERALPRRRAPGIRRALGRSLALHAAGGCSVRTARTLTAGSLLFTRSLTPWKKFTSQAKRTSAFAVEDDQVCGATGTPKMGYQHSY